MLAAVAGHPGQHPHDSAQRSLPFVEEIFGRMKSSAHFARSRWPGLARTQLMGHMVAAAYNLLRMGKLLAEVA